MKKKKVCFMIFPFNEPYKTRTENKFMPALKKAGLSVDFAGKPGSNKVPDEIEEGIKNSLICFADITKNKPNVWYEVGFAYACRKPVVLVRNTDILKKLPFDIGHKNVISYQKRSLNLLKITDDAKNKKKQAEQVGHLDGKHSYSKIKETGLTKGDFKVLKKILSCWKRHGKGYTIESLKKSKLFSSARLTQKSIDKLIYKGLIKKCRVAVKKGAKTPTSPGYKPTNITSALEKDSPNLFRQ